MDAHGETVTQPAPEILTRSSAEHPVSYSPVLTWTNEANAVSYQLEFFPSAVRGLDPQAEDSRAVFRTSKVYENAVNLPLDEMRKGLSDRQPLWWRVRALDHDGVAISPFSRLAPLYASRALPRMNAPVLHPVPDKGRGSAMIFPVYSWVKPYGTTNFEVALYTDDPERKPDAAPIAQWTASYAEQYDDVPRIGNTTYYWRVRALDEKGTPGVWSATSQFRLEPQHWEIAVIGDSISHGGGHISHGPENLEYSWLSYLNFPAVNLSQSGDITKLMADRFERDVLPFSPDYLLIMCGTNDLRAGEFTVEEAIGNMERIKEKCVFYGIRPIFLTLPPINPSNIGRFFGEEITDEWQERFAKFNNYLRQQPHIDTAAAFTPYAANGELPEWLGLDGLHEDIIGKQLIAARINSNLEAAKQAADEFLQIQQQANETRKEIMTDAESN
ncbi:MAG: GDSL family lipase [Schwartzia sp.]|nr:GDSL family lipase [Schwartzia sp. (in: firmicutes)]